MLFNNKKASDKSSSDFFFPIWCNMRYQDYECLEENKNVFIEKNACIRG